MKQCENCGAVMQDESTFCMMCGAQAGQPQQQIQQQLQQSQPVMQPQAQNLSTVADGGEKDKRPKWLIPTLIGVAGLVVGVVATWGIMSLVNGNKSSDNGGSNNGGNIAIVDTNTKVSYAGYEFSIPKGYEYEVGETGLKFTSNGEYAATISYYDKKTFSEMKNRKEELATSLAQASSSVSGAPKVQIETAYGKEFLVFGPFDYNSKYGFAVLISEAADLYCFQTNLIAKPGNEPLDYFDEVAEIVASAQKKQIVAKRLTTTL